MSSDTEKRNSSVSFSKSDTQTIQEDHPSDLVDEEHIQLARDPPRAQTYLAEVARYSGCWGRFFPIPFERASQKSWWDPTFDSEILEDQYRKSSYSSNRYKFRCALGYILLISICWFIYFLVTGCLGSAPNSFRLCAVFGTVILSTSSLVMFTTLTGYYQTHVTRISITLACALCFLSLLFIVFVPYRFDRTTAQLISDVSPVGHFSMCIEILLIIYTLIPLKLYVCISIGVLYSALFEILSLFLGQNDFDIYIFVVRFLSHLSIHLIGLHILIMTNIRMRNTFMKVGQSLLVRKQLESEKKLKENMIQSLMPPLVAQWLLNDDENFTKNGMDRKQSYSSSGGSHDPEVIQFRPFNMNRMEKVSILFADIVGFTKMSSNKSADKLVEILNNLFQKFDLLCKLHNCEKISTLGDCYYCVSGCPEPRADHARCCVEMGLSMIQAIKQFDRENNEGVDMRVGVHTGTVLCGIVGTKRFKFDVWSNDVTLANRMESTGKPGMVHVSEKTTEYLDDLYVLEEGEVVFGMHTFFILGRKSDRTPSYSGSFRAEGRQKYVNNLHLFVSPPQSSPSMSPQSRPRVLSCDTSSSLLKHSHNPNMLSPDVCKIKASSLPSILDSDNEQDLEIKDHHADCEHAKTPTSTGSAGKYSAKIKSWKIPKFMRKSDHKIESEVGDGDARNSTNLLEPIGNNATGYKQVPTIIEILNTTPILNGTRREFCLTDTEMTDTNSRHGSVFLDEQKDTIDVKSYISQSRSDIGQFDFAPSPNDLTSFARGGSYRSQYGRSPNELAVVLQRSGSNRTGRGRSPNSDLMPPKERARSATVAVPSNLVDRMTKSSLEVPSRLSSLAMVDDHYSTMRSTNSRKDSGIRSTSRRSSIQHIDDTRASPCVDILQHRGSGYFTSSQSTVNAPARYNSTTRTHGPFFGKSGTRIQNLRKQSDRQLIKCVQDNSKSTSSYFIKPPISAVMLFFNDKKLEQDYRTNVHSAASTDRQTVTLANSKFNTYFDVFVSSMVFSMVSFALATLHGPTKLWSFTFLVLVLVQSCGLAMCFQNILIKFEKVCCPCVSRFYRWNFLGGILVSLPIVEVMINFCSKVVLYRNFDYLYAFLLLVGLVHFCNFTQLSCWMKIILATFCGVVFIVLILTRSCSGTHLNLSNDTFNGTTNNSHLIEFKKDFYQSEIIMDILLVLVLVWLLNRDFEIVYRLSFHTNYVANRDKIHVQTLKNQADYLIYNIVPEHVADQLKQNAKYSENFENVGIIFASVVNFNEMYDESYLGGKEFLRVLNELIADFDELLNRPEFESVEKIKTIGSTFMAASGLNSSLRKEQTDQDEHLYALMDFALEMQNVVDEFNRNLLEFNLILRVGYNFGDVTAAVIGQTKLYYDIWGDAVNIASRMDTTGVNGFIQVGEDCLKILGKRYVFKARGSVFVKGKDDMSVFLLERKKSEDEIENEAVK